MTAPQAPALGRRHLLLLAAVAAVAVAVVVALCWPDDPPVGSHQTVPEVPPPASGAAATAVVAAPAGIPSSAGPAAGEARTDLGTGTAAAPLGDLLVVVEASTGRLQNVPLALTWTTAALVTDVAFEQVTDAQAMARFPRQFLVPRRPTDVPCIDLGLPTSGAFALQFAAATERLDVYCPDRGGLHIAVVEADGAPLRASALAEIRVLQATPPADRRHLRDLLGGQALVETEASGLQLQVAVTTRDGRRSEPLVVTGPTAADAVAECVVRMPPRDLFSVRVLAGGEPLPDTGVEVWQAAPPIRLDEDRTTDHDGRIAFPAPPGARQQPVRLQFLATDRAGRPLHGSLLADLRPFAAAEVGDVALQACVRLCAGVCLDEQGQPAAGLQLVVQTERPPELGRGPLGGTWIDLPMRPVRSAADGSFEVLGPPQFGRPLRLRARGRPEHVAPFVEGAPDLRFALPAKPALRTWHR